MKIIKRYANRRLYDAETSRTVTLEEVAEFLRKGEDIKVVDNVTGEDITNKVLGQTFLKIQEPLPQESQTIVNYLLKALIRESQEGFFNLVRKLILAGVGLAGMPRSEREAILKIILNPPKAEGPELKQTWINDLAKRGQKEADKLIEGIVKSIEAIQVQAMQTLENLSSKAQIEEFLKNLDKIRNDILPKKPERDLQKNPPIDKNP